MKGAQVSGNLTTESRSIESGQGKSMWLFPLRLLWRGGGVWGQAPELETRNLKKNKKFSFNIYSDFLLTQSYFHWLGSWVCPEVEGQRGAVDRGRALSDNGRALFKRAGRWLMKAGRGALLFCTRGGTDYLMILCCRWLPAGIKWPSK